MEEDIVLVDNLEIHKKDKFVVLSINPKLYPLEIIYSTAYFFMDCNYVIIDGDPKEEIIVKLRPKFDVDIENLGREFNNELINYMTYMFRTIRSQNIRESIVQRALATNAGNRNQESQVDLPYKQDLDKIAKPWKNKNE